MIYLELSCYQLLLIEINPLSIDLVTDQRPFFYKDKISCTTFPYSIDSADVSPVHTASRWAILIFFGLKLQQLHGLLLKYQYAFI
jgi:hypothetical protein